MTAIFLLMIAALTAMSQSGAVKTDPATSQPSTDASYRVCWTNPRPGNHNETLVRDVD